MKIIAEITSAFLIGLFLYTGLSKLLTYNIFVGQLMHSPLLINNKIDYVFAALIIAAELSIVAMFFFPKTYVGAFKASAALLLVFTVYLVYMVTNYDHLPCSCGGIISKLSWKNHIILNTSLAIMAILSVYFEKRIRRSPAITKTTAPITA